MFSGSSGYNEYGQLTEFDHRVQAAALADGGPAQMHLRIDAAYEVTDGINWDKERMESQAAERSKLYPDVYVNGEDVTVTVDPYGKRGRHATYEMSDDTQFWRHKAAEHRGALKDHRAVVDTIAKLDAPKNPGMTFIPTTNQIDKLPKFSPLCVANSTHGKAQDRPFEIQTLPKQVGYRRMGSSSGQGVLYSDLRGELSELEKFGDLPPITQMIYNNALPDLVGGGLGGGVRFVTPGVKDVQDYENRPLTWNRGTNRAFECGELRVGTTCR